jgi:hypothetical protein
LPLSDVGFGQCAVATHISPSCSNRWVDDIDLPKIQIVARP